MTAEEATFTVELSESELTLLISALAYNENRQLYLATLATNHGREKESVARRESAATAARLEDKLYAIGAKEAH